MESYPRSMDAMKTLDTHNYSHSIWMSIPREQCLERLLLFVKGVVEYIFGMYIGFAIGWLIGLWAGQSYVDHFEPVYLDDFRQVFYWKAIPCIFAKYGAMIGLTAGVMTIAIINGALLNQRIISLYEKGINLNDMARLLGKSIGQIERRVNKLAQKRRITS